MDKCSDSTKLMHEPVQCSWSACILPKPNGIRFFSSSVVFFSLHIIARLRTMDEWVLRFQSVKMSQFKYAAIKLKHPNPLFTSRVEKSCNEEYDCAISMRFRAEVLNSINLRFIYCLLLSISGGEGRRGGGIKTPKGHVDIDTSSLWFCSGLDCQTYWL